MKRVTSQISASDESGVLADSLGRVLWKLWKPDDFCQNCGHVRSAHQAYDIDGKSIVPLRDSIDGATGAEYVSAAAWCEKNGHLVRKHLHDPLPEGGTHPPDHEHVRLRDFLAHSIEHVVRWGECLPRCRHVVKDGVREAHQERCSEFVEGPEGDPDLARASLARAQTD